MSADQCLLVKAETVDMVTGDPAPLYFSAGAGPHTYDGHRWTDAPLEAAPLTITQRAFPVEHGLGGRSLPSFGSLELPNHRGTRDLLAKRAWDGRPITAYRGPVGAAFGAFTPILVATTDQPTFTGSTITVPLQDASRYFDRPALTQTFTGGGTYEGYTGLTATRKPRLVGRCEQLEPVLIDPANNVFLVSHFGIDGGPGVFEARERGLPFITSAGPPTDFVSDVYAWAPIPGHAALDSARGVFRLGAQQQGVITCTAQLGLYNKHGSAVTHVLQQWLNFSFGPTVDLTTVNELSALNTALPGEMGFYLRAGDTSVASVLDTIATSGGFWWGVTPLGRFTARRWAWSTPVATLREGRDLTAPFTAERVETPVWRLRFRSGRQYRPLTEGEIGDAALSGAARGQRQLEFQQVHTFDDTPLPVATRRRGSRELTVDSLYTLAASTEAFLAGAQQAALLSMDRWRLIVPIRGRVGAFAIADTVRLDTSRYGFGGTDWLVIGQTHQLAVDLERDRTTVHLWGPRNTLIE